MASLSVPTMHYQRYSPLIDFLNDNDYHLDLLKTLR
jgi:hypothetical protein